MNSISQYFRSFFKGLQSLLIGMGTTLKIFFRKKTTECYPENRKELPMYDRYRGTLIMIHNENNEHHCVACGICQTNCPNNTIHVYSQTTTNAEGKNIKELTKYEYDLGSCLFCQLCVRTCPQQAITFSTKFENAVFTKSKLIQKLNHEGSHLEKK
ncbi:MAG: 4Fe-4S binding protein [Bacteroidales bacterium]